MRFSSSVAENEQKDSEIAKAVDDNPATGWSTGDQREASRVDRQAIFVLERALSSEAGTQLAIRLRQDSDRPNAAIGRFRLSVTTSATPTQVKLPLEIERILALESARRTPEQKALIAQYYRSIAPELEQVRIQLGQLREGWEQATSPTTLVMQELNEPRKTEVFVRGSFLKKGKEVAPGRSSRPASAQGRGDTQSACSRKMAGRSRKPAGWPGHYKPHLDGPFRASAWLRPRRISATREFRPPIPNCWIG